MTKRFSAIVAVAAVLTVTQLIAPLSSSGGQCDSNGSGAADGFQLSMLCAQEGQSDSADPGNTVASGGSEPAYAEYVWSSVCVPFNPSGPRGQSIDCAAAQQCADPAERTWELWGRERPPNAGWALLGSQCFGRPPTAADLPAPQPTVTPALVLNAIKQIGLPSLEAETQPSDKTLVNFETIFYTEPQEFTRTVTLLGQSVDIEATPSEYTWDHGDGTTLTTSTPGAPYPSKEITHSYTDAHVTVAPRVDVTYTARFRVNGGGWQDIDETVTIAGPPTALRISEATALLSGEYE